MWLQWDLLASFGCILVVAPCWQDLQAGVPQIETKGKASATDFMAVPTQPWLFIKWNEHVSKV